MDAPERIWATVVDGYGGGSWGDSLRIQPHGTEYVRADLLEAQAAQLQEAREIIANQLEALEAFGISGGSMPEARAFLAKSQETK
jgi:hypothetical protein